MADLLKEPMFTELVRGVFAAALAISLPFVIYFASPTGDAVQAYQDALAAVVAFYFGTSSQPRS